MATLVGAARELPGVIHCDIARDLTDERSLIATEVFEDREAMAREEALPEVAKVIELMQGGALAGAPEWTIFEVALVRVARDVIQGEGTAARAPRRPGARRGANFPRPGPLVHMSQGSSTRNANPLAPT
ncbi:MAG: putative quinol monooxygenase, partial [Thermoleophilaceae bacterium]